LFGIPPVKAQNGYRIYSSITRTFNFLIENWYNFFFTFSQLRPTFMLQRRCRPFCCNILYYYIIDPK